ncbi:MAG: helix-turn-helix domain-containing protein [Candidatus Sulfotelmatobacter sp.]|jgi:transcriptional regulator with XRE-family HTH domain
MSRKFNLGGTMSKRDFSNLPMWLPQKIEKTGLKMSQVANRVGISRATLYEYLRDRSRPTEQTMLRLCRVLGVPFEQGLAQYTPRPIGRPRANNITSELKSEKNISLFSVVNGG